jgi:hypothetical protein
MRRLSSRLAIAVLLLTPSLSAAQAIAARSLAPAQVPPGVAVAGRVEAARQWSDRTGENLLLLTRTPETTAPDPDGDGDVLRSREMHAYHYVRQGAGYRLLWQTVDFVRDCELDLLLQIVPGSVQVTDVDGDGVAETSYAYLLTCTSDVSPLEMKLILHEGAAKYAIRGTTDLRPMDPRYPAPEMRVDPALQREPTLLAFAERQWRRFVRLARWPAEDAP